MENVLEEVGWLKVNNVYVKKVKSVKVSSIQGVTLSSVRRPSWVTAVSFFVSSSFCWKVIAHLNQCCVCLLNRNESSFLSFHHNGAIIIKYAHVSKWTFLSSIIKTWNQKNVYFPHWMHLQDASFHRWKRVLMCPDGGGTLFI